MGLFDFLKPSRQSNKKSSPYLNKEAPYWDYTSHLDTDVYVSGFFFVQFEGEIIQKLQDVKKLGFYAYRIDLPEIRANVVERNVGYNLQERFITHTQLSDHQITIGFYMDSKTNLIALFTKWLTMLDPLHQGNVSDYTFHETYLTSTTATIRVFVFDEYTVNQVRYGNGDVSLASLVFKNCQPINIPFQNAFQPDYSNNQITTIDISFIFRDMQYYSVNGCEFRKFLEDTDFSTTIYTANQGRSWENELQLIQKDMVTAGSDIDDLLKTVVETGSQYSGGKAR